MAKKKILFVSTNESASRQIAKFLSEFLYQIHPCNNSKMALDLALDLKPDLVLCDDNLDVLSGKELARLFKSSSALQEVPFLLMTMQPLNPDDMLRTGQPIWADDLLRPPITQSSIYSMITQWLESEERPLSITERWAGPLKESCKEAEEKTWKRGKLDCTTLSRLLYHLSRHRESGVVTVQDERRRMELAIGSGQLLNVSSNYIRTDSLGAFLERIGKITAKENLQSLKIAAQDNIPQGQALLQMNLLEKSELEAVVTQQKKLKVMRLFRGEWRGASFNFMLSKVDPGQKQMTPVSLMEILRNGLLRVAPSNDLLDVFIKNDKMDCIIHFQKDFETIISDLILNDEAKERAKSLEGMSISQIHNTGTPRFDEYLRLAFLLVIAHAVKFGENGKTKEAKIAQGDAISTEEIKLQSRKKPAKRAWDISAFQKVLAEGRNFIANKDFNAALPFIEEALKINPESSDAISLKAWSRYNLRNNNDLSEIVQCKEWLKQAIDIDESNDLALLYLGIIFKDEGKSRIALLHFQKAFAQNPTNEEARREIKLAEIKRRNERSLGFRT